MTRGRIGLTPTPGYDVYFHHWELPRELERKGPRCPPTCSRHPSRPSVVSRPSRPNGSRPPAPNPTNPALVGRAPIPAARRHSGGDAMNVWWTVLSRARHSRPDRGHRVVRCRRVLADRPRAQHRRRQRAHRRPPRPLRPAGPSHVVLPAVRRPAGHLDHHAGHRLSGRTGGGAVPAPGTGPARPARRRRRRTRAGRLVADRDVTVDGVRRTRAQEPGGRPTGAHRPRHRRTAAAVLEGLHARPSTRPTAPPTGSCAGWASSPPRSCASARTPAELVSLVRNSARSGSLDEDTASWSTGHCSSANAPPRNS